MYIDSATIWINYFFDVKINSGGDRDPNIFGVACALTSSAARRSNDRDAVIAQGDNVPGRKALQCTRDSRDRAPVSQRNVKIILAQRDRLIADIATLRQHGAASKVVDNAQQLLTRWWSAANWRGRQELLRSADWLLRLAQHQGQPPQRAM